MECDNARLGRTGASSIVTLPDVRGDADVADRLIGLISKKSLISPSSGVVGVVGDESIEEVSPAGERMGVPREKSESLPECTEEVDEVCRLLISGAVRACTLVVEINSVGSEIKLRSKTFVWCLSRVASVSLLRLTRLVKARARAMGVETMVMMM